MLSSIERVQAVLRNNRGVEIKEFGSQLSPKKFEYTYRVTDRATGERAQVIGSGESKKKARVEATREFLTSELVAGRDKAGDR